MKLGDLLGVLARGMHVVSLCTGQSRSALVALGATAGLAEELVALHKAYFGPTAFSRKQRVARATTHSVETLREIERYAARVKTQREAWELRVELCGAPEADVARLARTRLRELRPAPQPAPGVRVLRRKRGPHSLVITDSPRAVADMVGAIRAEGAATDALAAVRRVFAGGGSAPALQTNVIVPLGQLDQISAGDGADILVHATDGGTMTGAEFIEKAFADIGFVTLIEPDGRPLNLCRTRRFATEPQRTALSAIHPTCAWLGCRKPADECQFHHIRRWEDGGETNLDNLVPLCKYHNAINDDDPAKPTGRGRIARVDGAICWLPPSGGPPITCPSPVLA